jgi:hypothetical protein
MATSLGTLTEAVSAGMLVSFTVLMPAVSISLCTSPTDQQQIGQPGISTTAFTPSLSIRWIIDGVLCSNSTRGCRM